MFTALGSISHENFYVHAEWTKTKILYGGNFDFHFQTGDMPPRAFAMFSAHAVREVGADTIPE